MYTINNFPVNTEKCTSCQGSYLEYIGSQAYCSNCNQVVNSIEQEIKIVPSLYNGNSQSKVSSIDKKMLQYITQFSNKFGGLLDKQQQKFLCEQAKLIHKIKGLTSKGFRQDSAVVVYHYFKNTHKLNLRQFCIKNQLKQKPFNKSYIAYSNLKKQQQNQTNYSYTLKREQPLQKIEETQSRSQQQQNKKNQSKRQNLGLQYIENQESSIQRLVNRMFKHLFAKNFYQENKQEIIDKLISRVLGLYQKIDLSSDPIAICFKERIDFQMHSSYLLFCVLKKLKMRISIKEYIQTLKACIGQSLKLKILSNLSKLTQTMEQLQSNSDEYEPQNDLITGSCSQTIKLQNQSL